MRTPVGPDWKKPTITAGAAPMYAPTAGISPAIPEKTASGTAKGIPTLNSPRIVKNRSAELPAIDAVVRMPDTYPPIREIA